MFEHRLIYVYTHLSGLAKNEAWSVRGRAQYGRMREFVMGACYESLGAPSDEVVLR